MTNCTDGDNWFAALFSKWGLRVKLNYYKIINCSLISNQFKTSSFTCISVGN
jgi:hypothetical protein